MYAALVFLLVSVCSDTGPSPSQGGQLQDKKKKVAPALRQVPPQLVSVVAEGLVHLVAISVDDLHVFRDGDDDVAQRVVFRQVQAAVHSLTLGTDYTNNTLQAC